MRIIILDDTGSNGNQSVTGLSRDQMNMWVENADLFTECVHEMGPGDWDVG